MSALDPLIYSPRIVTAAALGEGNTENFFDEGIGAVIQAIFFGVGILICVAGLIKVVGASLKGQIGGALKTFVGTVILAAFCFNLSLINTLIDIASAGVEAAVDTFGGLVPGSGEGS